MWKVVENMSMSGEAEDTTKKEDDLSKKKTSRTTVLKSKDYRIKKKNLMKQSWEILKVKKRSLLDGEIMVLTTS